MNHTIKAVKTDHSLARKNNLLNYVLYEMGHGHNKNLVNTLITKNVINFSSAWYTNHVIDELVEPYGEEMLSSGLVQQAVVREGLTTELKSANGQSWQSLRWESLRKYVPYIIVDEVKSLGLNVAHGHTLKAARDLSKQLSQVKRNLLINYGGQLGCHMPEVDIVIYHPDTSKVLAVVSGKVTSNRLDQTIKLSQDEITKHIKVYFIGTDEDDILSDNNPLEKGAAIIESELNESYILTEANPGDNAKTKLFARFIEDLKEAVSSDINRDALSNTC